MAGSLVSCLLVSLMLTSVAIGQAKSGQEESPVGEATTSTGSLPDEPSLQFSFSGAPWRSVIEWVAGESKLALHFSEIPTGSFTYTDPQAYTPDEAISRINLFLLPRGYSLVRSGRLLSLLNLEDPIGMQQLNALAEVVTADQLADLNSHDVVKCIFSLGDINIEDAVDELSALSLMTAPATFGRTNRLMITDTVGKLRSVKMILDGFKPSQLGDGMVVENFRLEHVTAEDILEVVRPHLGLATGESIGIDISISADPQGKNIFVTGADDKVKMIENLVKSLDQPDESQLMAEANAILRTHRVGGGNAPTVYNVLLTLLAGQSVRLSMDEAGEAIVALASPELQAVIEKTVEELQGWEPQFAVIQLEYADPFLVVGLLEQMLDLPDPFLDDTEEDESIDETPKIDADPNRRQLFVRAKPDEIERIKEIVAELDVPESAEESSDTIVLLSIPTERVPALMNSVAKFWKEANLVMLFAESDPDSDLRRERVVASTSAEKTRQAVPKLDVNTTARVVAGDIRSRDPEVRCQPTSRGLLVQCDDPEVLGKFAKLVRSITGVSDSLQSPPIVFYLKYTRPEDAIRMLAELLDGGDAVSDAQVSSLVNGILPSDGTYLGSLVTTAQGTTTMTAGTMTVVADSRLNRLIAQGTAQDIEMIEGYLRIIDKENSLTSVETYGRAHVIELVNSQADVVAETLREAYGNRILGVEGSGNNRANRPNQQRQPQSEVRRPNEERGDEESQRDGDGEARQNDNERGRQPRGANQPVRNLEPKMTVAVHEPSNSLIITAPDLLFQEVEQLVKLIDARNETVVDIIQVDDAAIIGTLQSVLGEEPSSLQRNGFNSALGTTRPMGRGTSSSRQLPPGRFNNRGDFRRGGNR